MSVKVSENSQKCPIIKNRITTSNQLFLHCENCLLVTASEYGFVIRKKENPLISRITINARKDWYIIIL